MIKTINTKLKNVLQIQLSWETGIQAEVASEECKNANHSALVTAACAVAIHRKFMALVLSDGALFSKEVMRCKFWIVDQAELEKLVSGVGIHGQDHC